MKRLLMIFSALPFVLAACSGGNSSSSPTPPVTPANTSIITGIVANPYPIENARIELRVMATGAMAESFCGENSNAACYVYTDANGEFKIYVPEDKDMSPYYFSTVGGVDSNGTELGNISLKSAIEPFITEPVDDETPASYYVIISPVTTVVTELTRNAASADSAAEYTGAALNLGDGTDLMANPREDLDILAASSFYMKLADTLKEMGSEDPTGEIIEAILANLDKPLSDNDLLSSLFAGEQLTEIKDAMDHLEDVLANEIDYSGTVDEIISDIFDAKTKYMFDAAMQKYIFTNTPTAQELENSEYLYGKLKEMDAISDSKNAIESIVKYIKADYSSLDFTATHDNFTAACDTVVGEPAFINTVTLITRENAKQSMVPLSSPLKTNLDKVEYYFNSDLNTLYKARKMVAQTGADVAIDDTYALIVGKYAYFGLYKKAYELANLYVIDPLNRARAVITVADGLAPYIATNEEAKLHFDKYMADAKDKLDSMRGTDGSGFTGGSASALLDAYLELSVAYDHAFMETEADNLRKQVLADIKATDLNESDRISLLSTLVFCYRNYVDLQLRPAGDYETGRKILDEATRIVAAEIPASHWAYAMHLGIITQFYSHNQIGAVDYTKTQVRKTCSMIWDIGGAAGIEIYYAGACLWAYGNDAFDATTDVGQHVAADIETVRNDWSSYYGMRNVIAAIYDVKGFEYAKDYLEAEYPLHDGGQYGNLWAHNEVLLYDNVYSNGVGMASYALQVLNNYDKMKEVLEYVTNDSGNGILDSAAAYYSADSTRYSDGISDLVAYIYDDSSYDTLLMPAEGTLEVIIGTGFNEYGYLQVAHLYNFARKAAFTTDQQKADADVRGKAAIAKVQAFLDHVRKDGLKSLQLMEAYVILAHYYTLYGMDAEAKAAFNTALDIDFYTGNYTDTQMAQYYYSASQVIRYARYTVKDDAFISEIAVKGKEYADKIAEYANTLSAIDIDTAKSKGTYLLNAAEEYNRHGFLAEAEQALEEIVTFANSWTIPGERDELYYYAAYGYALIDMADEAYNTIKKVTPVDQVDYVIKIAEVLVGYNDFQELDIAFIDTDKDGKPDFISPLATPEHIALYNLVEDDDSDGDGILDVNDPRPFYYEPLDTPIY